CRPVLKACWGGWYGRPRGRAPTHSRGGTKTAWRPRAFGSLARTSVRPYPSGANSLFAIRPLSANIRIIGRGHPVASSRPRFETAPDAELDPEGSALRSTGYRF